MQAVGKQFNTTLGDQVFTFETGRLAGQAGGALTLRVGDTMVFAAATMSSEVRPGIDFFPLDSGLRRTHVRRWAHPRFFLPP